MRLQEKEWLICLDIDGTVLSGSPEREARFRAWAARRGRGIALAYASGRSIPNIRAEIIRGRLPAADFLAGQLGTVIETADGEDPGLSGALIAGVHPSWSLARAMDAGIGQGMEAQEAEHLNAYKASFYWDGRAQSLRAFEERISGCFPEGSYRIIAVDGMYVDLMPHCLGKAAAAKAIAASLGLGMERILVAGDSENDQDMYMEGGFKKILPANAANLLRRIAPDAYQSPYPDADGVLDGLGHFGIAGGFSPGR
jgi:hydroxymethylpyrimidine pyrophosphatase-like HAD family hydrolase